MPLWLGRGTAVNTGKVACLGHFPDSNEGALVEIDGLDLRVHNAYRNSRLEGLQ